MDALAEHAVICDMVRAAYAGEAPGLPNRFLEVGAFDGGEQSPVRPLFDAGWTGTYVEPGPQNFLRLLKEMGPQQRVTLVHAPLVLRAGLALFFDDGGGQVGSVDLDHVRAFKAAGTKYTPYLVAGVTPEQLVEHFGGPDGWRMLSIDAEGLSVDLLRVFPLRRMKDLDLVVVEHDRRHDEVAGLLGPLKFRSYSDGEYNSVWARGTAGGRLESWSQRAGEAQS